MKKKSIGITLKNKVIYKSIGCLILLGGLYLFSTLPSGSAQISKSEEQFENECREILNEFYLKSKARKVLIEDYLSPPSPFQNPSVERHLYDLRLDLLKSLLSQEPSVCYDLETLEKMLMGEVKPPPTPIPTPPQTIVAKITPTPFPTPTKTPTPLPTKTPTSANVKIGSNSERNQDSPEEKTERWKRIIEIFDKLFPADGAVEEWVRKIKRENPSPKPDDIPIWRPGGQDAWVNVIEFEVRPGKIKLQIPNDIRPGDIITGTISAEPKGNTEEERKKNEEELEKYGLEIYTFESPNWLSMPTPPETSTDFLSSQIKHFWRADSINSTVSFYVERPLEPLPPEYRIPIKAAITRNDPQTKIPIELVQLSLVSVESIKTSAPTPTDSPWQMPEFIQAGKPVEIRGKFDGIAGTTKISIDGKPLEIIAESPRSCIFRVPSKHKGPGEVKIKELDKESRLTYTCLTLDLSTPKLNLMRGEKTTVTVQVSGLKDLPETEIVPLQLVSSGVINMAGGDSQSLQIRKKDVDKDGVYRTTREVTGHNTGGWGVTATVIDPRWRPIFIPLIPNSKGNGYRSEKRKDENFFTAFEVRHPLTGKPLEGEHEVRFECEQSGPNFSRLPMLRQLFFKNGRSTEEKTKCLLIINPRIIIKE
jgi:hypothetical protein